ncbi:TRAP-type C4-dicarboxylate transport system permease small subunit [Erwinia toletana]|uniref:TRAP transporter small permease protein n=1 Tax=Winslowiella toletana TaxID=92490 RepID=A0ABS4P6L6_9GAMM|nr:TRAP transporter small permease [Winslowiella toletana]MBP2168279.1 TRAP-type C4-dicarboxylate transport system permease small subunit [Winslowiella toletana]
MANKCHSLMDGIYLAAMVLSGAALLVMTLVVPFAIFMRYVLNDGSPWPEPLAIMCMVTFTFIGAAVSYRAGSHIAVSMLTDRLPENLRLLASRVADLLMLVISLFILWYSSQLCLQLWGQPIAEFPLLSAGQSYLPVPIGAALTLLFVLERLAFGSQEHRPVVIMGNT